MKKIKIWGALAALLSGCGQQTLFRAPSGLQYEKFPGAGDGPASAAGCTVKFRVGNEPAPRYQLIVPGVTMPYTPEEVFVYGLKEGDSVVVSQRLDSMIKKGMLQALPAGKKTTDEIRTGMRVLRVFAQSENAAVEADQQAEKKKDDETQTILGPQRLAAYIKQKNIAALELSGGAWLSIIEKGNGAPCDTNAILIDLKMLYPNGTLLAQRDSANYLPGKGQLPRTVDSLLQKQPVGARLKIWLPTMQAFGGRSPMAGVPAYTDLVFDVHIRGLLYKH